VVSISFMWKVIKDLDSIDPDEREELWDRLEGYGIEYTEDVKELAEKIREFQAMSEYSQLRNLGDWNNVARYWIADRYTAENAKFEVRSSEFAAEQLKRAKRRYNVVKNLRITTTKDPVLLEKWKAIRTNASLNMQYWQAVLDHRQESYVRLVRRLAAARRARERRRAG